MTHTTKHTPGPLRVEGTHLVDDIAQEPLLHAVIRDSTERWVALVEITDDEGQANAHLIAVAPDMLEALHVIKSQSIGDDWTAEQALQFIKQRAQAAIAKAEGHAQ